MFPIWSVSFSGGMKTGEPGEKPSWQGRESTTNSTHIWHPVRESNKGHVVGDECPHHREPLLPWYRQRAGVPPGVEPRPLRKKGRGCRPERESLPGSNLSHRLKILTTFYLDQFPEYPRYDLAICSKIRAIKMFKLPVIHKFKSFRIGRNLIFQKS